MPGLAAGTCPLRVLRVKIALSNGCECYPLLVKYTIWGRRPHPINKEEK